MTHAPTKESDLKKKRTGVATAASRTHTGGKFKIGESSECTHCGAMMVFQEGLTHTSGAPEQRIIIANLSGFVCMGCKKREWDPQSYEVIRVQEEAAGIPFAVRGKLTRLSGGKAV